MDMKLKSALTQALIYKVGRELGLAISSPLTLFEGLNWNFYFKLGLPNGPK